MANYKRKKSRRQIRCSMCTPYRWLGNSKDRHAKSRKRERQKERTEIAAQC